MSEVSQGPGWWLASDGKWYAPTPMPPPPGELSGARLCVVCGGGLRPVENRITRKRRSKFGLGWLLFTLLTGGLALILYLIWPRHSEVVGVDRYVACTSCGARQP